MGGKPEDATGFITDKDRIDWLADKSQTVGNIMLPTHIVENELLGGLRAMIDAAMEESRE